MVVGGQARQQLRCDNDHTLLPDRETSIGSGSHRAVITFIGRASIAIVTTDRKLGQSLLIAPFRR